MEETEEGLIFDFDGCTVIAGEGTNGRKLELLRTKHGEYVLETFIIPHTVWGLFIPSYLRYNTFTSSAARSFVINADWVKTIPRELKIKKKDIKGKMV